MEDYSRQRHEEAGYVFVNSPHITKSNLFETSGHLDWFADGMFPPMELDERRPTYYLKPMNCPFHILIYQSRMRSYRELPLRFFEFGTVYRYEKSGVVHGLTRVRGMTQDDAHIFCTQGADGRRARRARSSSCSSLLRDYGLDDFYLELSTKPEGKAVGTDEEWDEATEALRAVAARPMGLELVLDEGGGAFYGPKISVQARDAIGRTWQLSTIQLDFQLPQRFDLEYVGADNERHRPIMIHRALFGAIERFFAILLEHYAGAFPAWLAPVQVTVLPGGRPARRLRARRGRPRCGPTASASSWSTRTPTRSARASATPRSRRCRTCSSSATTTSSRHRGREPARGRRARARGPRRRLRRRGSPPSVARTLSRDAPMSLERLWAGWRAPYIDERRRRSPATDGADECLFCRLAAGDARRRGAGRRAQRARVRGDERVPVHVGHLMVAPLRHEASLEGLAARRGRRGDARSRRTPTRRCKAAYGPDGINVGMNLGGPPARACPATCTSTSCRAGTATPTS